MNSVEDDFFAGLAQIQAESIGFIPLSEGAYMHVGSDEPVIQVAEFAKAEIADSKCCGHTKYVVVKELWS
jgi:hypothetical protein